MDWGKGITNCVWSCVISFCALCLLIMAIYQKRNKGADFEVPPSFPPPYLHPLGIPLKDNSIKLVPLPQVQHTISPAPPSYKSHSSRSERSKRSRSRSPSRLPRPAGHVRSRSASNPIISDKQKEQVKGKNYSRTLTQPQRRKLQFKEDIKPIRQQIKLPLTGIQNKSYC